MCQICSYASFQLNIFIFKWSKDKSLNFTSVSEETEEKCLRIGPGRESFWTNIQYFCMNKYAQIWTVEETNVDMLDSKLHTNFQLNFWGLGKLWNFTSVIVSRKQKVGLGTECLKIAFPYSWLSITTWPWITPHERNLK